MSATVLTAIINIVNNPINGLRSFYRSKNRANNMGEALENYVKDMFAGTLEEADEQKRLERFEDAFSYQGNQNNPPDIMIRDGDAIEVKKIENHNAQLALNSSYPKAKLFSDSTMITAACRACEQWTEKDILYVVGVVDESHLSRLFFVYGIDYAASAGIYERIKNELNSGLTAVPDVDFVHTKELGRVNRVDPLGITHLRIRGMWVIENPVKAFSYVYTPANSQFELACIINAEKYSSFSLADRNKVESINHETFRMDDIKIKSPDNPTNLKPAKLITFRR
jgi:hypothetical protein